MRREDTANRLQEQATFFRLPREAAQPQAREDEDDDTEVWPENTDAFQAFLDLDTYWRRQIQPMTGHVMWDGLLPEGVREVLHAHGHRGQRYREVWADIKVMERAALSVLNESDKK